MAKNSFLQAIFPKIKYSISPISKTNKGTTQLGKIIPVYATMLNGKESVSLDLGHLVRFAPLNVPTMEGYEVNFEAFKVSLNAIAYSNRKEREVMDFHNFALNDGSEHNPFCKKLQNMQPRRNGVHQGTFQGHFYCPGLLGDYLNFPSMKAFRDYVREWCDKVGLVNSSVSNRIPIEVYQSEAYSDSMDIVEFVTRGSLGHIADPTAYNGIEVFTVAGNEYPFYINVPFFFNRVSLPYSDFEGEATLDDFGDSQVLPDDSTLNCYTINYPSLLRFILLNYPKVGEYYFSDYMDDFSGWIQVLSEYVPQNPDYSFDYLQKLYEFYKVDVQSVYQEWFNGLCAYLTFNPLIQNKEGYDIMHYGYLPPVYGSDMKPVDWSYFAAYWKIISDWYINTNIDGDPDTFFISKCNVFSDLNAYIELEPFERRWANDIFTSSVPSSMVQNIAIPADGTIPDLRQANAYQKFKDILRNTGKRLRDVMFGVRGYRPSAEASHMSVPVGTLHSYVGMSSILQTTPTDANSPQGSYAGIGTDTSGGNFRHILKVVNNDEPVPVVVMVLMSITQKATYFQGFPRYFFRDSIYDFAVPQLANIGEQEVMSSELYFDYDENKDNDLSIVFGFNRRYYDWFFEMNEVHGEMRDTEDFWHGAREFDSIPALNSEFIAIKHDKDHLSRVFANTSPASFPIYYNVFMEGEKCVALPRYIQYDL